MAVTWTSSNVQNRHYSLFLIPDIVKCIVVLLPFHIHVCMHIHLLHFYRASSSPLLLRGAADTAWILCLSFMSKRHRQLQVKDLPKVLTWWRQQDSNLRLFGQKAPNLQIVRVFTAAQHTS